MFDHADIIGKLVITSLLMISILTWAVIFDPKYLEKVKVVNAKAEDIYRYMNFDQIPEFRDAAETVTV